VQLYDDTDGSKEAYGFIDESGEVVISLKSRQGGSASFEKGYARYQVDGKTVLIDHSGETYFKTSKGNIQGYKFGLVSVFSGKSRTNWGWINTKDEVVIPLQYDYAVNFSDDGLAIVEKDGLKGVIDTTGKQITPMKYKSIYAHPSKDGFMMGVYPSKEATSLTNAKKDYYDAKGNLLSVTDRYIYHANHQDLIMFKTISTDKQGYLNRSFEVVIPAKYSQAYNFSEGFAWVR
jgi:hypothetical protein